MYGVHYYGQPYYGQGYSASASASISPSASMSVSISPSASLSPSASASASPSAGYTGYTRGNYAALPTNDNDLTTTYTAHDVTDVATNNNIRVTQFAQGQYAIHQYKNFVGAKIQVILTWEGQTDFSPVSSTVFLQIYNRCI